MRKKLKKETSSGLKKILFCFLFFGFAFLFFVFSSSKVMAFSSSYNTSFPETNGEVDSVVVDEDNNILYLGGNFTVVGGVSRNYLAAVNLNDNSIINSFNVVLNGRVNKIVLEDGNLYLGGDFTSVNGNSSYAYLAAVNASDGSLVTNFDPVITPAGDSTNTILDMQFYNNNLYFGGTFTALNASSTYAFLAATTKQGDIITDFDVDLILSDFNDVCSTGPCSKGVGKILVYNDKLYFGGPFYLFRDLGFEGAIMKYGIASVNVSDGSFDTAFQIFINPGSPQIIMSTGYILDMEIIDEKLYLAGTFNSLVPYLEGEAITRDNLAVINLSQPLNTIDDFSLYIAPDQPDGISLISSIEYTNNFLYLIGMFNKVGMNVGSGYNRNNVASFYLPDMYHIVRPRLTMGSFNPDITIAGLPDNYLFLGSDSIYAYGNFNSIGGYTRDYIAEFNEVITNISFTSTTSTSSEDFGAVSIELQIATALERDCSVNYTISGTASNTEDFVLSNGTATIQGSNTTTSIDFLLIDDEIDEEEENLIITLSNPNNCILGANTIFTYNITDNDDAGITQSATTVITTEEGLTDSYTFVLDSEPTSDVVITVLADSQSSVSSNVLTFTNVNWDTAQTITVSAIDDSEDEDDIHSSIISHTVSSSDVNYNGYNLSNVTVTITDNDISGGGFPPGALNQPQGDLSVSIDTNYAEDYNIIINDGEKYTNNRKIKLKLIAGSDVDRMSISEDADFIEVSIQPYQSELEYVLSDGYGEKEIYVYFYTKKYGIKSNLLSDKINYINSSLDNFLENNDDSDYIDEEKSEENKLLELELELDLGQNLKSDLEQGLENYTLFRYSNNSKIYLLENGFKRWIRNGYTFNQKNYAWSDVQIIDTEIIYPDGEDLNLLEEDSDIFKKDQKDFVFTRYLYLETIGIQVRNLQIKLRELGYLNHVDTAYYGPLTRQAVIDFQKDYGLNPLGVVGPETRALLNSM